MSLKKIGQVKADKGFKIWDLIIYGVIIALVAALFIAVFATRDDSPLRGIRIYSKGEAVFEYSFQSGKYEQLSQSVEITAEEGDGVLLVTVKSDVGYNKVEIKKSGSVRVTDADCKNRDCVYSMEIKDNGGIIYCSPHGLRIVPYDFQSDGPEVIV